MQSGGIGQRHWGVRCRSVAALSTVAVAVVTACSSPATLDSYIGSMESATDAYVVESQALSFDYQSSVEDGVRALVADDEADDEDTEAAAIDLVRAETVGYLAQLGDAMSRYGAAITGPEVPGSVRDAHDDYVEAVGFVVGALPAARESVEAAATLDGIQRALTASGFADGQLRWTAMCSSLEQAVRDQGRGLDLQCNVEPTP